MGKLKSARRAAEQEARRPGIQPAGVSGAGEVMPLGYLFGGLLMGFLGGGLSMRAWDANAIAGALRGMEWEREVGWTTQLAATVPAWLWTLVLFACAAVVLFGWMPESKRTRMIAVGVAVTLGVVTMAVLGHALYQPVMR